MKEKTAKDCSKKDLAGATPGEGVRLNGRRQDLLGDPFAFLYSEHKRQRIAATQLQHIASGGDVSDVTALRDFLTGDYALHRRDEREAFFPLLQQQCLPRDKIDLLIARLDDVEASSGLSAVTAAALLDEVSKGRGLKTAEAEQLAAFATQMRRHLAIENSAILPIAQVRFDANAVKEMSDRMRAIRSGNKHTTKKNGERL